MRLEQKILTIKAEQEAVLSSMAEEVDAACCSLLKNAQSNLKVFICWLFCCSMMQHVFLYVSDLLYAVKACNDFFFIIPQMLTSECSIAYSG